MTNSHNRATQKEGRNSESRSNASPNHQKNTSGNSSNNGGNQNGRKVTFFNDNNTNNNNNNNNNNNKGKGYYAQKHSSSGSQYYSTSPKEVATPPNHAKNNNRHHNHRNHQNGSPHGVTTGRSPPRSPISFASPAGVSTTTPNLHFAGSKYFDAPSPNALPRPPGHWTSQNGGAAAAAAAAVATPESATSKRRLFTNDTVNQTKCSLIAAEAASKNLCSDIFSHNLKLLLNVQA